MITVVAHSAPAAQQVSTSVPVNRAYVVKPGDNLWSIAEQYYGTGFKWDTIYHANSGQIGGNPNAISAGQVLAIPGASSTPQNGITMPRMIGGRPSRMNSHFQPAIPNVPLSSRMAPEISEARM